MKEYPSILGSKGAPELPCIAFYKLDGSNLRFEWSRKTGFYKFGTRRRLFDKSDAEYGCAIEIFNKKYGEDLSKIFRDKYKAEKAMAFGEFFGPQSFAGQHVLDDPKDVVLFDINIHKKGILGPEEFIKNFGHLHTPVVIYEGPLTEEFIQDVRQSKYLINEGVVAKGGQGHNLWMRKIKTLDYLKRLQKLYENTWQELWE